MAVRVFVPRDAAAVSLGADEVAAALAAAAAETGREVEIVRNGSRGMVWLEPLVEVEVDGRRIAYGPVVPGEAGALIAGGLLEGAALPLRLGPVEEIPYFAKQERLTFARVGVIDPVSVDDYLAHGR
jgi:formate dehydrogenase iron-sulfur subunit